jgi:hypothetical protein
MHRSAGLESRRLRRMQAETLRVADYTLAVVPAGQEVASGKVVGHCQGDQQIVYTRGAVSASSPASNSPDNPAMPMNDDNTRGSEPTAASTAGH